MRQKKLIPLVLALALAAGCANPPSGGRTPPSVARTPEDSFSVYQGMQVQYTGEQLLAGESHLGLRCADLSGADLAQMDTNSLFSLSFDTRTVWPGALPQGFDPQALLELGKDPGLGVRALHRSGLTGKGVGIAIIDQTLLTGHREYADRLRYYAEYHTQAEIEAQMHGPAVASIALGETVGVAPEALLYYIADDSGTLRNGEFQSDMSYFAQDIDRLVAMNETLPAGEKIRVISISCGYTPDTPGVAEFESAVARAQAAGVAVFWCRDDDPLMGMARAPMGDPNNLGDYGPGLFLMPSIHSGTYLGQTFLLAPMDHRVTAAPTGAEDYAYYPDGGLSWTVPYVAGLYALACQAQPEVTLEAFMAAAESTAVPLFTEVGGAPYQYGRALDPAALLAQLTP